MPFVIIFLILPLTELFVFASVSEHIGIWTTLLLALLTAIIGGSLVKMQGLQAVFSARQSMNQGTMPLKEIFDGFCIVAAGALLITPGFITDTIGFTLLFPPARVAVQRYLQKHTKILTPHDTHPRQGRRAQDGDIIEGEYERVDDR